MARRKRPDLSGQILVIIVGIFVVGLVVLLVMRNSSEGDKVASTPKASTTTPARADSTVGVTDDTVEVGILLVGLGDLASLGAELGIEPEAQRGAWTALIDAQNAEGGFHGRKIVPVFEEFNVTDTTLSSLREACVAMAEDHKVFAVLASVWWGDPVSCITERYETPLINPEGSGEEFYSAGQGRLVTLFPGKTRGMQNAVDEAEKLGMLDDATIGLLGATAAWDRSTLDAVEPALAEHGHELAVDSRITTDKSKQPAEVAVQVQAMKAAEVDLVIGSWFPEDWMEVAETQGFKPQYLVWDMAGNANDTTERADGIVSQLDGMVAVTSTRSGEKATGVAPSPQEQACAAVLEDNGYDTSDRRSTAFNGATLLCDVTTIFAQGLRAAGPDLTRDTFTDAVSSLRDLELVTAPPGSGFPSGRTDYGTVIRAIRWSADCSCYQPINDYHPATH